MRLVNINQFERVSSTDVNNLQKVLTQALYDDGIFNFFGRTSGFLSSSLACIYSSALAANLNPGSALIYDGTQVDPSPKYTMILARAQVPVTFAAANTQDRIDLVCIKQNFVTTQTASRFVKTGGTGPIVLTTVNKLQSDSYTLLVVTGTPSGSPAVPSTPSGYQAVAKAYIHANTGMAGQSDITDLRTVLTLGVSNAGHVIATSMNLQGQLDELDAFVAGLQTVQEILSYVSSGLYSMVSKPTLKSQCEVRINGVWQDPATYTLVAYGGGKAIQFTVGNIPDNSAGDVVSVTVFNGVIPGGAGGGSRNTNSVSTDTTLATLTKDLILLVDTSAGPVNITLADAVASDGWEVKIKNIGSPVHPVNVLTQMSQKIDNSGSDSIPTTEGSHTYDAAEGNWWNS